MQFHIFFNLISIFLTNFFIVFEITLAHLSVLLKFVMKCNIFFESTFFLTLNECQFHFQFIDLSPVQSSFFPTLFGSKIDVSIDWWLSFFFKHSNIGLFLFDNFLYGLGLYIPVLPWAESVHVFHPLFNRSDFNIRRLKLVDHKGNAFIDLGRFQVCELLGNGARRLDFEKYSD